MKTFILLALVGFAAAECPNACSGHGTCGAKDSCSCYQNYQGNDCSERTCYFGIAHVDTPKGDLNADGFVSGPLTTVVTGSEVYPWGTTEQFPNADANEGHFYMECSNKGICDRKSGQCDCFDGYTGTACSRAACANDCSGHGTCESIKELAEMRSFDTNAHDVPSTRVAGSNNHHNFNSGIEESYSYDLWDQDKTMGCKCDPVYYGADCSLKKCKYGVDPLFYDNTDGVIRQTTVVHVGSTAANKGKIKGTFKIVFYDVFGEKYVTKGISAGWSDDGSSYLSTALGVREALEALPNGVISKNNQDVTSVAPAAVTVSMAANAGTHTTDGGIGAGSEGSTGAGLGARGSYGSEYTITFASNPGVLKSIELDTRQINNPGSAEYWVANSRQGQFKSRYTYNNGRINTLKYGSKLLFTNSDWTAAPNSVSTNKLVKVGGQEFRVTGAAATHLTLNEPFLGASIVPVLTDTATTASAFALGPDVTPAQTPDQLTVAGVDTAIKAAALAGGAKIYINGCPLTTVAPNIATSGTALDVGDRAAGKHDCAGDFIGSASIIYRRSDDPNNQNMYSTSGDTGAATTGLLIGSRGSADVYFTAVEQDNAGSSATQYVKAIDTANAKFTFNAAAKTTAATVAFVNGFGPIDIPTYADDVNDVTASTAAQVTNFFGSDVAANANAKFTYHLGKTGGDAGVAAGAVLLLNGRRYRVRARTGTAAKVTLNENYAGGQLRQVCASCITAYTAAGTSVTSSAKINLDDGARIVIGGFVQADFVTNVIGAVSDATAIVTSAQASDGTKANIAGAGGDVTSQTAALYTVQGIDGVPQTATLVTEASSGSTYHYVAQCSNRGSCDAGTGLCKCFKGYSNDNCDTQNMLAA